MTSDKREFINGKIEEIDNKLKEVYLCEIEQYMLKTQRAEYEEQIKELSESDENNENEQNDDRESIPEEVEECIEHGIESEYSDTDNEQSECLSYESVYFKYCFEHCTNIDDIIHTLESLKQYFEQLKNEGHELTQPVDSGYCFIDKVCESDN